MENIIAVPRRVGMWMESRVATLPMTLLEQLEAIVVVCEVVRKRKKSLVTAMRRNGDQT